MTKQKNKKRLVRARMEKTGESHQAAHRAVSSAVERSPQADATSAAAPGIGSIVAGRYRLLRLVAGGAGRELPWSLYDAQHVLLGGDVALKLLHRQERSLRPWFLREGRALERAAHPQVIRVFDIGETEEGDLYLILDRAPRMTLASYLHDRPMESVVALDLLRQLARLFEHLHDRGVTPRALGSSVIHLEQRGDTLAAKIGSLAFADLASDPRLALPDTATLNPAWMSPEECRGAGVDPRSALYTLGLLLHVMLTRRLPFQHADTSRLLELQRDAAPPPLRAEAAPSVLDAICLRLLSKDPDARYPSATALLKALRGLATR